jgi:antitoxin YefM
MNATLSKQVKEQVEKIAEAMKTREPTLLETDSGERAVVMPLKGFLDMSPKEVSSWQETLYLLSNPVNARSLLEAIGEIEKGKFAEKELLEP